MWFPLLLLFDVMELVLIDRSLEEVLLWRKWPIVLNCWRTLCWYQYDGIDDDLVDIPGEYSVVVDEGGDVIIIVDDGDQLMMKYLDLT